MMEMPGRMENQIENPNETLEVIRAGITEFFSAQGREDHPERLLDWAEGALNAFVALDEHLRGGGYLPDDWCFVASPESAAGTLGYKPGRRF